jgi:hypothetical protein
LILRRRLTAPQLARNWRAPIEFQAAQLTMPYGSSWSEILDGSSSKSIGRGDTLAQQLHDEPKLSLSHERLDHPNDPEFAADLYPVTDLEGALLSEVTR